MLSGRLASYHAATAPEALAVIDGERRLTYGELNRRVNRLANALTALGIRRGDRGAILMRNQHQFLEAYLAYSKCGAITVALNFRLSSGELAYQIKDAGAVIVIVDGEFARTFAASFASLEARPKVVAIGNVDLPGVLNYEDTLARARDSEPVEGDLLPGDANVILYTSGTTGFPKGATLSHANQFWSSFNIRHYYRPVPGQRSLVTLPLYHTAALNFSAFSFLHAGATVVMQRAYDPDDTLRLISEAGCTSLFVLPQMWGEIAARPLHRYRLRSLRELVGGGGLTLESALGSLLVATGGQYSFLMGMTEVGTFLNYLPPEEALRKNGSVGMPTIHCSVRIIDDDNRDVAPGSIGEMVIRGPTVFSGYWNRPQETANSFVDGWFRSGDLVRADDEGFLYIVDRKKDMIRSGGENIYSIEVERVLERHPAVAEAAIVGVPDPYWGEAVRAYVALRPGIEATADELIDWCRQSLASYKKPRSIVFVDRLPRNATGKILKHLIRADEAAARARS